MRIYIERNIGQDFRPAFVPCGDIRERNHVAFCGRRGDSVKKVFHALIIEKKSNRRKKGMFFLVRMAAILIKCRRL